MNYIERNRLVYDELADEFKKKINLRADRTNNLVKLFSDFVYQRFKSPRVLDLGPGSGYEAKIMVENNLDVTCVELSAKMAKITNETAPSVKIIVDDFIRHDFGQETFSAIYAVAFIHLFPHKDAIAVIKKIYSLLDQKGIAFISTTENRFSDEGFFLKTNFEKPIKRFRKKFTRKELEKIFLEAGFTTIYHFDNLDIEETEKSWMNFILEKHLHNIKLPTN